METLVIIALVLASLLLAMLNTLVAVWCWCAIRDYRDERATPKLLEENARLHALVRDQRAELDTLGARAATIAATLAGHV